MQFHLARRNRQADVAAGRQALQHVDDLRADEVVGVEIGADHADRKRRRLAGQRLADALAQHRKDFHELVRVVVEYIADRGIDLARAAPLPGIDLHLEFALVGRIRILSVLGAADLLGHAFDAGYRNQSLGDLRADAGGFGKRNPGTQRGMRDQVILAEIRQQACAQQGQTHDSGDAARENDADERTRPLIEPRDHAQLPAFQMLQKSRLVLGLMPRHHQRAQRRRRAHGDQQRQTHGEQERNRQRPEKGALQSGHHQYRQKRDRHRRCRIEHRPPHLEGGADEQGADVDVAACAAPAPENVFDVDDGVIDHHAERDNEAAERHGVEAQSPGPENPNRRQQGERDGAEGNQGAAPVAQGDEQQGDHEHGADGK